MYLHAGNHKNIKIADIVGIFDTDSATVSKITKQYLSESEKRGETEIISFEIPKSFILFEENGLTKVCISPLSSSALRGRINDE